MRTFELERQSDETGVSGTGVVVEGVAFTTGVVVAHWLTPAPWGSVTIWPGWATFMSVHVWSHPTNSTRIHWDDGEIWEPEDVMTRRSPWPDGSGSMLEDLLGGV